jgi:hypothetical protein
MDNKRYDRLRGLLHQVFYLNVNYNILLAFPPNENTPFVVVANDKRCYTGRFDPPKDTTQPNVTFFYSGVFFY